MLARMRTCNLCGVEGRIFCVGQCVLPRLLASGRLDFDSALRSSIDFEQSQQSIVGGGAAVLWLSSKN